MTCLLAITLQVICNKAAIGSCIDNNYRSPDEPEAQALQLRRSFRQAMGGCGGCSGDEGPAPFAPEAQVAHRPAAPVKGPSPALIVISNKRFRNAGAPRQLAHIRDQRDGPVVIGYKSATNERVAGRGFRHRHGNPVKRNRVSGRPCVEDRVLYLIIVLCIK
jgi:hypothetical protein